MFYHWHNKLQMRHNKLQIGLLKAHADGVLKPLNLLNLLKYIKFSQMMRTI